MINPVKMVAKVVTKEWDHRYFRLRKGNLYWYVNERSREAQNKVSLVKIDDIVSH